MHIIVVGVDHISAPIALRERLACSSRQVPQVLLTSQQVMQESILLSTCNRVELYSICPDLEIDEGTAKLLQVLSQSRHVPLQELQGCTFSYSDEEAIVHLFGVASGLYSLVPGEAQIQGQVANALQVAQSGGYAGPIMSALFRAALVAGKRARSETGIGRNATSISHVAVQLARQLFPRLNEACVLLVGSGQMSELAARNLCDNGAQRLVIINRTQSYAVDLAQRFGALYRGFPELADALVEADVVISSTTAPRAIITHDLMRQVMNRRNGRSLLLIDIALPRDIEPDVATLTGVHLYNLDDLQVSVSEGIRLRMQEVTHVQRIILEEVAAFERWLRSLSVVDTVSDLRHYADALRQKELARTMRQISSSVSERETVAVQELTTRLVNKLLHTPTLRLKEAAAIGQGHVYAKALRYLFDLEEQANEEFESHEGEGEDEPRPYGKPGCKEAHYDRDEGQQTGDGTDLPDDRAITAAVAEPTDKHRADSHHG